MQKIVLTKGLSSAEELHDEISIYIDAVMGKRPMQQSMLEDQQCQLRHRHQDLQRMYFRDMYH